jgi:hypothetical protein
MRWQDLHIPWAEYHKTWATNTEGSPQNIAGNQQGFVSYIDQLTTNEESLQITAINGNTTSVTTVEIPDHNLSAGQFVEFTGIIGDYSPMNNTVYAVFPTSTDLVEIFTYDPDTLEFSEPDVRASGTYLGGGVVRVRDNFRIVSKKFNYLNDGQSIQLGFIDILTQATAQGAFSLYVYRDYNDTTPINTPNQNEDPFFNNIVPTTSPVSDTNVEKVWNRVYCNVYASFITLEYTLSNEQMNSEEHDSYVQIDAQILYKRPAGRELAQTP